MKLYHPAWLFWIISMAFLAYAVTPTVSHAANLDLENRNALRLTLDNEYALLEQENALVGGPQGTDVAPIVERYIGVGMSLTDAESILHAAGFSIDHSSRPNADNADKNCPDKAMEAMIDPYAEHLLRRDTLYVTLISSGPCNKLSVKSIRAAFVVSTP